MEMATARATSHAHGPDLTRSRRQSGARRPQTFRVMRAADHGSSPIAPDVGANADGGGRPTMPRATLGALRDARTRLRTLARVAPHDELESAIATFVVLAWDAGFSRMATCSVVAAALEEGLPRRRGWPVRVTAASWERHARTLYDAIALGAGGAGQSASAAIHPGGMPLATTT